MIPQILNVINLPFIGQINLPASVLVIFIICLVSAMAFEFVNGFHDTANAVATVIYTKALRPAIAIPWSGFFNFLGVFTGGVAVAMGILKLVPLDQLMTLPVQVGACMVLSVLLSSIIWNLGTWYLGIPCSSSHTLIGAIIGASLAFTFYYGGSGVNWEKAKEIGLSLILSPIVGFGGAVLFMYVLKNILKAESLFHIPQGKDRPPLLIRLLLITTCTLVSFFHGSNDGQKGVGLLMLILIAFLPARYAINHKISKDKLTSNIENSRLVLQKNLQQTGNPKTIDSALNLIAQVDSVTRIKTAFSNSENFRTRSIFEDASKQLKRVTSSSSLKLNSNDKKILTNCAAHFDNITDYAPVWVMALISVSLGIGTMIGWKRIVITIGERIGKEHLNYAQGATAEIVAATTIGLSTGLGLPVSTTHVLSSGIAGAMVASKGSKNLNNGTLKSIAMAWILTLPVSIFLSIILFVVFHLFV